MKIINRAVATGGGAALTVVARRMGNNYNDEDRGSEAFSLFRCYWTLLSEMLNEKWVRESLESGIFIPKKRRTIIRILLVGGEKVWSDHQYSVSMGGSTGNHIARWRERDFPIRSRQ